MNSLCRVAFGLIKVIAVSPILLAAFTALRGWGDLYLAAAATGFIAYVYVNFSGYMDVVIGLARLFGIHLPENFDRPWMAANFINFWSRWHITLSFFFRDYLFYPLLTAFGRLTRFRRVLTFVSIGLSFFVFFLLGIWHGTTPMFILLGFALALGVSVNQIWSEFVRPDAPARTGGAASALLRHLSGALAVLYFALAAISVWPDVDAAGQFVEILRGIATLQGVMGALACLAALVALRMATVAIDAFSVPSLRSLRWVPHLTLGVMLALNFLLIRVTISAPPPQIYYEDF